MRPVSADTGHVPDTWWTEYCQLRDGQDDNHATLRPLNGVHSRCHALVIRVAQNARVWATTLSPAGVAASVNAESMSSPKLLRLTTLRQLRSRATATMPRTVALAETTLRSRYGNALLPISPGDVELGEIIGFSMNDA
eukprot:4692748-Prymnesium_polylepis.1